MRLSLLTAIHGREWLTALTCEYYMTLGFDSVNAVCTTEEEEEACRSLGINAVQHDNNPVSDKWNAGMSIVPDGDAVMILGSDDVVTHEYVRCAKILLHMGVDLISLTSMYVFDLESGSMQYVLANNLGLGRVLSAPLLSKLSRKPWPTGQDSGLDSGMFSVIDGLDEPIKVAMLNHKDCQELGVFGMDIKGSGNNIWSYKVVTKSLIGYGVPNPKAELDRLFPSISTKIIDRANERRTTSQDD